MKKYTFLGIFNKRDVILAIISFIIAGLGVLLISIGSPNTITKCESKKEIKDENVLKEIGYEKTIVHDSLKRTVVPICWSNSSDGSYYILSHVYTSRIEGGYEVIMNSDVVNIPVKSIRYNGELIVNVGKCYEARR